MCRLNKNSVKSSGYWQFKFVYYEGIFALPSVNNNNNKIREREKGIEGSSHIVVGAEIFLFRKGMAHRTTEEEEGGLLVWGSGGVHGRGRSTILPSAHVRQQVTKNIKREKKNKIRE